MVNQSDDHGILQESNFDHKSRNLVENLINFDQNTGKNLKDFMQNFPGGCGILKKLNFNQKSENLMKKLKDFNQKKW